MSKNIKKASVLGGSMIVAGTSIGAGMLALPTVSAGMWLAWASLLLIFTWFCMFRSSQAILEVNMHFEAGVSFHSLVKNTLGIKWSIINGISISFVLYILIYAYISGGSSLVSYLFDVGGINIDRKIASVLFALALIICIWASTWLVDKFSVIMVIIMSIAFFISMSGLLPSISLSNIFDTNNNVIYMWTAVSTYLTSFCFHGNVPSLVKYFGKEPDRINKCLLYGTLITLACYSIWIFVASGSISQKGFKAVINTGGNVGSLIQAANTGVSNEFITRALDTFAALALTTSFLGAGLGLFDYLADLFKIDDTPIGRAKTSLITFVPPMIGGIFFPEGFISAISWAGLFSIIWAVIVPALMVLKVRQQYGEISYSPFKGKFIPYLLIIYGIIAGLCHILVVFKILPEFK